jgi:ATP diphosphatase
MAASEDLAGTSAETAFAEAVRIMARLRAPGGCPWDREQTFESIRPYTVEETYEVLDALERQNWSDLQEELGDLLLQVLFYAEMAAESGYFTIGDVIQTLNAKLIRRHPHVFGEMAGKSISSARVLSNWERIKAEEREGKSPAGANSILDDVPRNLPAAAEAQKLGRKAAKVRFDWPAIEGLFTKLDEEAGDLLFTAVQLARHAGADAEMALRDANAKFRRRFELMEMESAQAGTTLDALTPDQLEMLWANAKSSDFRKDSSDGNTSSVK